MPVFEQFPYTNFHELNLDWILKEMKELDQNVKDLISADIIKYADPIQWSILTAYEKYTIVLDSSYNAYMSMQDVPAGTALTDTAYWQQIGDLYGYLEDRGITEQIRAKKHFRFYVNGSTGNDNNTGRSASQAFKTLDRFFKEGHKYTEIRCYITAAGTYHLTDVTNIAGLNLVINASVPGVIIELESDNTNNFSFYSSYLHLEGPDAANKITLISRPSTGIDYGEIYTENCGFNLVNVSIPYNRLTMNFNGLTGRDCDFKALTVRHAFARMERCNTINTEPNVTPWVVFNGKVVFATSSTASELTAASSEGAFIQCTDGDLLIGCDMLPALTNSYYTGIQLLYSRLFITTARLTALNDNSVNGNVVSSPTNQIITY